MSRKVAFEELNSHRTPGDVWLVVNDRVYDFSNFDHPGGEAIILQHAGSDASEAYNEVHGPTLVIKTLNEKDHVGEFDRSTVPVGWGDSRRSATAATAPIGTSKPPLEAILNLDDFEAAAKNSWSPKAWAYIHGAANDEITRDANRAVLRRIWLRPAIMRDVKAINMKTNLFGVDLDAPFYIAPTGAVIIAGADGELAMTRAAAAQKTAFCISTPASFPYSEILEASPPATFFQLYVNKDRQKSEEAVRLVEATGKVKAIFVTVDLPVMSKREADERIKLDAPVSAVNVGLTASVGDRKGAGLARQNSSFFDSTLNWEDIQWLKSITSLPIVLKGVQRWEDVKTAHRRGVQGVVLSNHGGRAADGAPPGIITLLECHKNCPEVFGSIEILVDGGFRRGSDVVKAICLGASAVGLGRPFLYSMIYGQRGVEHAIEGKVCISQICHECSPVTVLREEVQVAAQLCGIQDLIRDASPEFVNTSEIDALVRGRQHPYAKKIKRRQANL